MGTIKLVNMMYFLGSDAKELECNNFTTMDEAVLEAKRVSEKLNYSIPVFVLVNGVTVRCVTAFPDGSLSYDSNIFSDGDNIINTIISTVEEYSISHKEISCAALNIISKIAEDCEYVLSLLNEEDYADLLGESFIIDLRKNAKDNFDSVIKVMSRMDSIIDLHRFNISEEDITDVKSLIKSYDFTVRDDIDKSNKFGLLSLYKTLCTYLGINVQI